MSANNNVFAKYDLNTLNTVVANPALSAANRKAIETEIKRRTKGDDGLALLLEAAAKAAPAVVEATPVAPPKVVKKDWIPSAFKLGRDGGCLNVLGLKAFYRPAHSKGLPYSDAEVTEYLTEKGVFCNRMAALVANKAWKCHPSMI